MTSQKRQHSYAISAESGSSITQQQLVVVENGTDAAHIIIELVQQSIAIALLIVSRKQLKHFRQ